MDLCEERRKEAERTERGSEGGSAPPTPKPGGARTRLGTNEQSKKKKSNHFWFFLRVAAAPVLLRRLAREGIEGKANAVASDCAS